MKRLQKIWQSGQLCKIRNDNPLKQGLKLSIAFFFIKLKSLIRNDNPLKQGLKPMCIN